MSASSRRNGKTSIYEQGGRTPLILIKRGTHPWRKVVRFFTTIRPDDPPWRCLSCHQAVRVGQDVVVTRSAHEQTQGCYGPIESAVHWSCWTTILLTQPGVNLPELGPKGAQMERYGDEYLFGPRW